MLDPVGNALFDQPVHLRPNQLPILGMNGLEEKFVRNLQVVGLITEDPQTFIGPPQTIGVQVREIRQLRFPASDMSHRLGLGEHSFTRSEPIFRQLQRGDVVMRNHDAPRSLSDEGGDPTAKPLP